LHKIKREIIDLKKRIGELEVRKAQLEGRSKKETKRPNPDVAAP